MSSDNNEYDSPIYRLDKTFRQILNAYQSGKRILFKGETQFQTDTQQIVSESYFSLMGMFSITQNNQTHYIVKISSVYFSCTSLDDYPITEGEE